MSNSVGILLAVSLVSGWVGYYLRFKPLLNDLRKWVTR